VAYLLRDGHLGGVGGQVAVRKVCGGAWGGTAWTGSMVYLPCADGMVGLSVTASSLTVAWRQPQVRLASPIVSAGAVWGIDVNSAVLFALDPATGGIIYRLALYSAQHFSTGAATEGYVVVPAGQNIVAVATSA
jgi:hypothetical protein